MITSYCIMLTGEVYDKDGQVEVNGQIYDYGACFYPEGMITSDQVFAFNHDRIDRVCFKGYETENQKEISEILTNGIAELRQQQEGQK